MAYKDKEKQAAAARKHYLANKPAMIAKAKAANKIDRANKKALINEAKNKPCSDCGVCYPSCVMQFDHVRGVKLANVAAMLNRPIRIILEEIAKCEVVCANCHMLRTHKCGDHGV